MSTSTDTFYFSLARISALQILRASGIDRARPSVIDSFTDILVRYLLLLATSARDNAILAGREGADVLDVRTAMGECGVLVARCEAPSRPSPLPVPGIEGMDLELEDEEDEEDEDLRVVEEFVEWCRGPQAAEIRKVAGMDEHTPPNTAPSTADPDNPAPQDPGQTDWLTGLVRKQIRAGAEDRFRGSVLEQILQSMEPLEGEVPVDSVKDEEGREGRIREPQVPEIPGGMALVSEEGMKLVREFSWVP
ncbi:hypothetical protein SAICODRAFT_21362 [Saitoella complicata NRRL Y-17804]|uniref:uncharacterized protein n=1 Tax=Saitoella complicata (strain BCRC 22490 / CBS 7301 / JCM 7358 / NBRC 10748 / NRRL Y-17804) TaxID=698492 RepID=UPI0008673FC3|nr:uncharacterized protein SAICODRAFT_21362 [Saitoella complicata NRRL Y-17804]ODQ50695.1 hypothetical protein SAICODRAFT_21362 [Saitoella complicata NRRL Y-17804]